MITKDQVLKIIQSRSEPVRLKTIAAMLMIHDPQKGYCGYFSELSLNARIKKLLKDLEAEGRVQCEYKTEKIVVESKERPFYGAVKNSVN